MFLVAGTFFPLDAAARVGAGARQPQPAVSLRPARPRRRLRTWGWADVGHLAFLVGFALVSWRLAIRFMERKLIL